MPRWSQLTLWQKAAVLLVIGIFSLVIINLGIDKPISTLNAFLFSPVLKLSNQISTGFSSFNQALLNLGSLRKENIQLQQENEKLIAENTKLKELEIENQLLREQLDLKQEKAFNLIPAEIIGKEPTNFIQQLIIDKGSNNHIAKGQPVVSSTGLLVGQIIDVTPSTARVLIITDKDSTIPAMVQSSRTDCVVKGQGLGYGLVMEYIPQDEIIKKNDVVITSGLGEIFPKGLFIGVVNSIEGDPSDVFQKAVIRPLVNFNQLEMVGVIAE